MLKKKYPNGVLFKIVDKIEDIWAAKKNKMGDFNTMDEDCIKPLNKEEFLKQFPENYIKNGKIVSVRGEIAKKIEGQTDEKTISKANEVLGLAISFLFFSWFFIIMLIK